MVEFDIVGVVNEFPVPKMVPPFEEAYQFKVPALPEAPKTTVPASHLEPGVTEVIVGVGLIVATIAVLDDVQPLFVALT